MAQPTTQARPQVFKKNERYTMAWTIDGVDYEVDVIFTGNVKKNKTKGEFIRVDNPEKKYTLTKDAALNMLVGSWEDVVEEF